MRNTITYNLKDTVRLLLALILALVACLMTATAAEPELKSTLQILERIRKKRDLPGLAVVVVNDGHICERCAVGVRKMGDPAPLTTNDVFHLGSCTKSMTATLAGMLIDEGKLRWDTTIAEVFPEWKGKMNEQYAGVTLEQLLRHRGGFPTEPPAKAWARAWEQEGTPVEQRREFIEAVLNQKPKAAPGTKMIYSNQGYAVAGAMIEKITGTPWETLITERLFKPLHMDSAGFGPPGTLGKVDQPWGHVKKPLLGALPVQEDNPPAISPAGRVHCSLDDLARFTIFHMQNDKNGLLKPETLKRLHTPPKGGDYACGWVVLRRDWAGGRTWMHNGSNTMWYVVMWLAPNKNFSVIAATNIFTDAAEEGCDDVCVEMIQKWLNHGKPL